MSDELYIPKRNPQHKPSAKRQLQAKYRTLRPEVRADTYARDGDRCRCCWRTLHLNSDNPFMHANIHETEGPRMVAAIDVTLRSTITLCAECHEVVEKNKLAIVYERDDLRCNGAVLFTGRMKSGEVVEDRRSEPMVAYEVFRRARAASNRVELSS